ncbi:DNA-binding transcriptional regulator, LysR family [Loktanella sp. DSM 29012]|uniref:LysR family transcriptional regulator n=1 Tax=Loktanella sp. DSM 29012 TaxID=1881056 RepID=UPI0008AE5447|nr:LysR family transcriptional regulator [Loktanella sp. DSM 29012]SEQ85893.1 DNA-binding transcriptional regulator, LysR family [Loktanella sp. DSM 29012]
MGERIRGDGRGQQDDPVEWNDMAAFLAIARHGGLSAAARDTGSSAPTLGRRMRALERKLGRELFVRRTHGYDLTEDGKRLQADLSRAESVIARAARPAPQDALPVVRITAGTWTMLALADRIAALTGDPPDLRVRLLQQEDVLSIPRREAAIGFRSQRPTDDGLAGHQLRRVEFAPYSTRGTLHDWIVVRADTPSARWVTRRCGNAISVETDTPRLALDLALRKMGRVILPTFVGDAYAELERAGPIVDELGHDQWLVTHNEDRHLAEVRRALDRITEAFG